MVTWGLCFESCLAAYKNVVLDSLPCRFIHAIPSEWKAMECGPSSVGGAYLCSASIGCIISLHLSVKRVYWANGC